MDHRVIKSLKGGSEHSVVNVVEIEGKRFVHKKAPRIHAERFFHRALDRNGLPSLEMFPEYEESAEEIVFEYIENSPSFAESRSVENYRRLGKLMRKMHSIEYPDFFNFDDTGENHKTSWAVQIGKYVQESFDDFVDTNLNETHDFSDKEVSKIEEIIKVLPHFSVDTFSLIHGDLHPGNILMRGDDLVIYDKDEAFVVAPLVFDLAMFLSEGFNSAFYVKRDDEKYLRDKEYLAAFIEGYGKEFIEQNEDLLKRYALLRALKRYPHPWMDYQVEMMRAILASMS